jgi:phosphohistidine phosphatase
MKLYIMRHGPAEDRAASGLDADRSLTADGRARVRSVAKALVQRDEAPVSILSSPLARALQTAEIVAAVTDVEGRGGRVEVRREIAPGGSMLELVDELRRAKRRRVMLVGHEPDLSSLVVRLSGRVPPQGMLKAMVVGLGIQESVAPAEGYAWTVKPRFLLDPKTLAWGEL